MRTLLTSCCARGRVDCRATCLQVCCTGVPVGSADAFSRFGRRRAIGDLSEFGLPIPEEGPFTRLKEGRVPSVVDMEVIDVIRDRSIEVVPTIEAFDGNACQVGRWTTPTA